MLRLLGRIPAWFGSLPTTTLAGRVVLSATGIFAIGALASGANGPILVLAVLLALVVVSVRASGTNLKGLEIEREIPARVRAGEEFTVRLRITNRRRITPGVAVRIRDALQPAATGPATLALPLLPPRASVRVSFRARIRRRGAYRITNAMLVTRFPFGLFERRALRRFPSEILVTPRELTPPVDPESRPRARRRFREMSGGRDRGTDEFLGLREYRPGDNPRWIAWKATARQGCLMVRELDRPRKPRAVLVLDTDTGRLPSWARGPALERAVSLAAGTARRLRGQRRPLAFATFEPQPLVLRDVARGPGHRALLEALAVLRAAPGRSPADLLGLLDPAWLRGSTVVLVTPRPAAREKDVDGPVRARGGRLVVVDASPGRRPRSWRIDRVRR